MKRIIRRLAIMMLALIAFSVWNGAKAENGLDGLSVSVESYTYGSERSTPTVVGNTTGGEVRYYLRRHTDNGVGEWKEITERPVSGGMPTAGGRYELKVTVAPTESYGGGSAICMFQVYPTELEITLSVNESIYFGDGCGEGELFTVGDLLGREYTVEFSKRGEDRFSSTEPTQVGEYTLRVSVRGSENYASTVKTADFRIEKRPLHGELSLKDVTVGFDKADSVCFEAEYVGVSGAVREELSLADPAVGFRRKGSGGEFSSTPPTEMGEYEVRLVYAESKNLSALTLTATLRITKASISPSVIVRDWSWGETPVLPELAEGSNPGRAKVTYYYKAEDGEFSESLPTEAGKYTVKAVVEESEKYFGGECFGELMVEKGERSDLSIVFSGWVYGEKPATPFVKGDVGGADITFAYSPRGEDRYSDTVPTDAGRYTVRAVVSAKGNYKESVLTADFEIEKADIYVSVFMEGWVYGEKRGTLGISGNIGGAQCLISYYRRTAQGYVLLTESELDGAPWNAGGYRAVCEVLESKNHKGFVASCEFTVSKAEPNISVKMDDYTFYGKIPTPHVTGNDGGGEVSFVYSRGGDDISEGSRDITDIVTLPGVYTVTAIVSGTDNYRSATARADFTVKKADLPVSSMSLSVKVGGRECESVEFGTSYEIGLKNNVGYGRVSYLYSPVGGGDAPADEKPTAVGKYTVTVTVEATEIYNRLVLYFELEITKISRGELRLDYGDSVFGESHPIPVLSGLTDELTEANKKYEYKPHGSGDSEYTSEIPKNAGHYDVRLTLSETESYAALTVLDDFVIEKAESVIEVVERETVYSGGVKYVSAVLNHTESGIERRGDGVTDVGEYEVTLSVPESQNYKSASLTLTFTVTRATGEINGLEDSETKWSGSPVSAPGFHVTGDGAVTVEYYKNGQKLVGAPSEVGDYTVRVILGEGKNYTGCTREAALRITRVGGEIGKDGKDGGGYLLYILILALLVLLAVALVLALLLARHRPTDPPQGLLTCGYGLPSPVDPAEGAEGSADEAENDNSDPAEGERAETSEKEGDVSAGKGEERRDSRGMIVLDMWREIGGNNGETGDPPRHPEVVYKRGGRCAEINIDTVCRHFEEGEIVDMDSLMAKGLINKGCKRVKLLGRGEMTKALDIRLDSYSKGAMESLKGDK